MEQELTRSDAEQRPGRLERMMGWALLLVGVEAFVHRALHLW